MACAILAGYASRGDDIAPAMSRRSVTKGYHALSFQEKCRTFLHGQLLLAAAEPEGDRRCRFPGRSFGRVLAGRIPVPWLRRTVSRSRARKGGGSTPHAFEPERLRHQVQYAANQEADHQKPGKDWAVVRGRLENRGVGFCGEGICDSSSECGPSRAVGEWPRSPRKPNATHPI
jgi:hypothetical protein